jgi:hypothetical protein
LPSIIKSVRGTFSNLICSEPLARFRCWVWSGKGYDCVASQFTFGKLPIYPCPVEIKNRSQGFNYQIIKYPKLPRAVVLCMEHNFINSPDHIDFIELPTLAEYLSR